MEEVPRFSAMNFTWSSERLILSRVWVSSLDASDTSSSSEGFSKHYGKKTHELWVVYYMNHNTLDFRAEQHDIVLTFLHLKLWRSWLAKWGLKIRKRCSGRLRAHLNFIMSFITANNWLRLFMVPIPKHSWPCWCQQLQLTCKHLCLKISII